MQGSMDHLSTALWRGRILDFEQCNLVYLVKQAILHTIAYYTSLEDCKTKDLPLRIKKYGQPILLIGGFLPWRVTKEPPGQISKLTIKVKN